jgi:nucleoside-diphosphate-sugar epimerase
MDGRTTVAITGVSGYVGQALLPYLEQDTEIDRVIGMDIRPPENHTNNKLLFHQLDVREAKVEQALEGADVLVHLAFVLMHRPGDNEREIDEINIAGSRRVFEAAARQGVRKLIFTSSVVAYGLHADNPIPLTEESPLRPNPGLYYSRAKAAVESYLDTFESEHPEIMVTRLRPCTVVGPRADPAQMAALTSSTATLVQGYDPPYQLLHEEDLARALYLTIRQDIPGIYNVTSDESRTLQQLARSRPGTRVVALPSWVVRGLMWLIWRLGRSPFAPAWVDLSRYPLVASNEKLKGLGWRPQYTTAEALEDLLAHTDGGSF